VERGTVWKSEPYVEDSLGAASRCLVVALGVGDETLGQALRFLGLVPCRVDGLVLYERGH